MTDDLKAKPKLHVVQGGEVKDAADLVGNEPQEPAVPPKETHPLAGARVTSIKGELMDSEWWAHFFIGEVLPWKRAVFRVKSVDMETIVLEPTAWRDERAKGDGHTLKELRHESKRDIVEHLLKKVSSGDAMGMDNAYGEILRILSDYAGETGVTEGAVETLIRLINERNELSGIEQRSARKPLADGEDGRDYRKGLTIARDDLEKLAEDARRERE